MSIVRTLRSIFVADRHNPVELQGVETWCVSWNARYDEWSTSVKSVTQAFTNRKDAEEFRDSLYAAFNLVRNSSERGSVHLFKM